jgi:predicted amidohydrolase
MNRDAMFRVAVLQFDPDFGQTEANLGHVASMIGGLECDLLVLPELFASGYWFESEEQLRALAEPLDGPTLERVREWAHQLDCAIAAGFPERDGNTIYNSALLTTPDRDLVHYRKLHLFGDEKRWFAPGDRPLEVVEFRGTRMGMMVCFDWRFPETARSLAFLGADLIIHPSNLVLPWCPDAMITRALENNVYIATADRWGDDQHGDEKLHFIGQSQVVSPNGERLGRLGEHEDGIVEVVIDPERARNKSVSEWNDLWGDLRPEFYTGPGGI